MHDTLPHDLRLHVIRQPYLVVTTDCMFLTAQEFHVFVSLILAVTLVCRVGFTRRFVNQQFLSVTPHWGRSHNYGDPQPLLAPHSFCSPGDLFFYQRFQNTYLHRWSSTVSPHLSPHLLCGQRRGWQPIRDHALLPNVCPRLQLVPHSPRSLWISNVSISYPLSPSPARHR